jgi:hypothetical protein
MPSDTYLFPSQQNESILKSINTSYRVHIILKSNRKKKQIQAMLLSLITSFFLPNLATHGTVDNQGNKDYSYPLELNPLRLVHSTILCSIPLLREVKEAVIHSTPPHEAT